MNEYFKEFEKWNRKEPLVVKIDYGYPIPLRFAHTFNALFDPISEIRSFYENNKNSSPSVIFNSHYLLSLRRKESPLQNLINRVKDTPVVFETRFLKFFKILCLLFEKEKVKFTKLNIFSDGSLPPLYSSIHLNRELFMKNLFCEWESGLKTARGSSALIEVAKIIAESKTPLTLSLISQKMGISLGAVASYLRWMEEASLIRKENRYYFLRHAGLYSLFKEPITEKIQIVQKLKREDLMEID